jgi:hypothetical protein
MFTIGIDTGGWYIPKRFSQDRRPTHSANHIFSGAKREDFFSNKGFLGAKTNELEGIFLSLGTGGARDGMGFSFVVCHVFLMCRSMAMNIMCEASKGANGSE